MNDRLETQVAQLAAIDRATLTPLVQRALGSETIEVVDWEFEQLHGGIAVGSAVFRFSGRGRDRGQTIAWSLILKVLRPDVGSADASAWNYYRREADAYRSGWLDDLPGGLSAPRCFGAVDHPDGTCWIWLEQVADAIGSQWPLEQYGVVARHLGQFNGTYLAGRPLPAWPWLSSDWLRHYIEQSAPVMEPLRSAVTSPWGRRWLPEADVERYFRLWAERDLYLGALDRLPQTVCHLDIFRRNLFAQKTPDGGVETMAIDWAFVGKGPIGAELHPPVWMSIIEGVGLDEAQELEELVFEGYLAGLQDAGWRGDRRQVRLGYTAAATRYLFPEVGRWLALILDESLHAGAEQMFGFPVREVFTMVAVMRHRLFDQVDEARDLMSILD
ncbi:MAG: hypothetical protein ACK2UA_09775 [Anaerolineae bacterium]|jgi:hypothetical protein